MLIFLRGRGFNRFEERGIVDFRLKTEMWEDMKAYEDLQLQASICCISWCSRYIACACCCLWHVWLLNIGDLQEPGGSPRPSGLFELEDTTPPSLGRAFVPQTVETPELNGA